MIAPRTSEIIFQADSEETGDNSSFVKFMDIKIPLFLKGEISVLKFLFPHTGMRYYKPSSSYFKFHQPGVDPDLSHVTKVGDLRLDTKVTKNMNEGN